MTTPIYSVGIYKKSDYGILVLQTHVFKVTKSIGDVYFETRASHDVISATPICSVGKI